MTALSLTNTATIKAENETVKISHAYDINTMDFTHTRKPILPGDSLDNLETARVERENQAKRDALARERVQSSPGYSSYQGAEIIGTSHEQCVIYAKRNTGINRSIGYAGSAQTQGQTPQVGSIGIMRFWGHAVVVEAINGDKITITESNWVKGKIDRRVLSLSELRGFIYN